MRQTVWPASSPTRTLRETTRRKVWPALGASTRPTRPNTDRFLPDVRRRWDVLGVATTATAPEARSTRSDSGAEDEAPSAWNGTTVMCSWLQ